MLETFLAAYYCVFSEQLASGSRRINKFIALVWRYSAASLNTQRIISLMKYISSRNIEEYKCVSAHRQRHAVIMRYSPKRNNGALMLVNGAGRRGIIPRPHTSALPAAKPWAFLVRK